MFDEKTSLRSDDALQKLLISTSERETARALAVLHGIYLQPFIGLLLGMRVQRCDADDIVAKVFEKIWKLRGTRKVVRSSSSYLFTICRNQFRDWAASSQARDYAEFPDNLVAPDVVDQDDRVEIELQLDCVEKKWREFSRLEPERAALLRFVHKDPTPTIAEIAKSIGRTEGATRTYLYETRKKLIAYIREHCGLGEMP
jgi:RNA polymerase sigma factor (sigma-70 family)